MIEQRVLPVADLQPTKGKRCTIAEPFIFRRTASCVCHGWLIVWRAYRPKPFPRKCAQFRQTSRTRQFGSDTVAGLMARRRRMAGRTSLLARGLMPGDIVARRGKDTLEWTSVPTSLLPLLSRQPTTTTTTAAANTNSSSSRRLDRRAEQEGVTSRFIAPSLCNGSADYALGGRSSSDACVLCMHTRRRMTNFELRMAAGRPVVLSRACRGLR